MENKKGKKLSLQKIKIAKLNRNGLFAIKGGTEVGEDFSATQCHTDTCPDNTEPNHSCDALTNCTYGSDNNCRSNERFCVGN